MVQLQDQIPAFTLKVFTGLQNEKTIIFKLCIFVMLVHNLLNHVVFRWLQHAKNPVSEYLALILIFFH